MTPDRVVHSGNKKFTIGEIESVDLWSDKGGVSANPPPFPGQTIAEFDVTNSASPNKHYPIFFNDVVDENIVVQPYVVEYRVSTLPAALLIPGAETILERLEGPNSGSLRSSTGKISYFDTPREGGVYKIGVSYGGSPTTETVLVLPLSGASVDAVVLADIGRAEDAVAYMNSHYSAMQRQRPAFGLQWFNNNGMGDYLGRVDLGLSPVFEP